jgi:hypothetical protein
MRPFPVAAVPLCLALAAGAAAGPAGEAGRELARAVQKTAALQGYSFRIDEKPGQGTGGAFEGRYEKGQPVYFNADRIEFYRKGDALAYKDAGKWHRSRTGTLSDPLRVLGGAAKARGARLPHEELAELAKALKDVNKAESRPEGSTVVRALYTGDLDAAGARQLAPPALRAVARGGKAKVWVGLDGQVHKYAVTLRLQGRLGNAEINGTSEKTVTLGDRGTARVPVPDEAKKALE